MPFDARTSLSNVRLPPDSTGKRLATIPYYEVAVSNVTHEFFRGDYVTGADSGAVMEVAHWFPAGGGISGILFLIHEEGPTVFTQGENLLHGNPLVPSAVVTSGTTEHHVQGLQLLGRNSPFHGQNVDRKGAAYVRFTEGEQQLDAYGLTRIAQPQIIAAYNFTYDEEPEDFTKIEEGDGASIDYNANIHAVVLNVGDIEDERAMFTSNAHYPIWPGSGQIVNMAVVIGDSGKAGCVRRWGYYNENDGVFYELDGTTLYLVMRSSVTGTPVDNRIEQENWSVDPMGAGGRSADGTILDVSKGNVYWFNFQTLTGGRVRCGVLNDEGDRIDVHKFVNLNNSISPQIRTGTLPFRVEIFNSAPTASPSQMRFFGATVKTESPWDTDEVPLSRYSSIAMPAPVTVGNDEVALCTFRSAKLFKNVPNRFLTVPRLYSLSIGGTGIIFRVRKNCTLTGANFQSMGGYTPVEGDMQGTLDTVGREIYTQFFDTGVTNEEFNSWIWDYRGEAMSIRGDGEYGETYTITAQKLDQTAQEDATVLFAATWADLG